MAKLLKDTIKEAREKFKQTQIQAAFDIGINLQTLRYYEYGVIPSQPTLNKIKLWIERNNKRVQSEHKP